MQMAQHWQLQIAQKSLKKQEKIRAIQNFIQPLHDKTCLEVGCDKGVLSYYLRQWGGNWTSIDADKENIRITTELVKENVQYTDGEHLVYRKYCNIGVAVDTPNGLVVPVIRDVDKKGVFELARELSATSARARDGKLTPADLQGGCFSISSLGGIGGTAFTPIINAPESAILGVSKAVMKPVWNGKDFEPRLILPLSLSYDHRVIDGADGVRFTTYLSGLLSDIRRLLL